MTEAIEVKAKVNSMEKGQVTTFEYEGNFYDIRVVQSQQKPEPIVMDKPVLNIEKAPKEKREIPDRGKCIGMISNNYLYENIYKEINEARDRKATHEELLGIIGRYHPLASEDSLGSYLSNYNRFWRDDTKTEKKVEVKRKPYTHKIKKEPKSPPPNALGYCENYGIYIYPEDYEKVMTAVNKYGGIATSDTIMKETGLTKFKVNGILRYMKDKTVVDVIYKLGQIYYVPTHPTKEKDNALLRLLRR